MASSIGSEHVSDPALKPFLSSSFDPAEFLNSVLPPLSVSTQSYASRQVNAVPLSELSSQTQTLLSHISASTARLTNTLTQLTDDILRCGGRLAYEVEVLRGESISLTENVTDGLKDDIKKFIPNGLDIGSRGQTKEVNGDMKHHRKRSSTAQWNKSISGDAGIQNGQTDPAYITQLRTLSQVRNRLEEVVKVFGEAMEWTIPPSEVTLSSSFITIKPEAGTDGATREQKGKEIAKKIREEISDMISGRVDGDDGIESANQRIKALRDLAKVWKTTAEEKARIRFVDELAKMVEDHKRALEKEAEERRHREGRETSGRNRTPVGMGLRADATDHTKTSRTSSDGGYAFINHLQRMRGGL